MTIRECPYSTQGLGKFIPTTERGGVSTLTTERGSVGCPYSLQNVGGRVPILTTERGVGGGCPYSLQNVRGVPMLTTERRGGVPILITVRGVGGGGAILTTERQEQKCT